VVTIRQETDNSLTKPPKTHGKTDALERQKRQLGETNPMESSNKSIEIVEQNQWNR
jgi:hypothetical protein